MHVHTQRERNRMCFTESGTPSCRKSFYFLSYFIYFCNSVWERRGRRCTCVFRTETHAKLLFCEILKVKVKEHELVIGSLCVTLTRVLVKTGEHMLMQVTCYWRRGSKIQPSKLNTLNHTTTKRLFYKKKK